MLTGWAVARGRPCTRAPASASTATSNANSTNAKTLLMVIYSKIN